MKKIFSLFAAVLFAGSMMAETVTLTMADFAATSFTDQTSGISVATAKNGGGTEPAYNATGKDLRIYAKGSITISSAQNITGISFTISTQGKKRLAPLTADAGSVTVKGDPDFTAEWTGSATSVTLTVGEKADYGTESSKAGQLDFTAIVVTLEGGDTPVEPKEEFYLTGSFRSWAATADANYKFAATATEGEYKLEAEFDASITCKAIGLKEGADVKWYPDGMGNDLALEAGEYTIYLRPAGNAGEGWHEGVLKAEKKVSPVLPDPTNCAEAREAALSVSANNEEYKGGKVYTIEGFVTEIAYAWKDGSMSFWMADAADGGKVLEAYKCAIEKEEDAVRVGDKVAVTGKLTKYNTTPEFAAGCTVEIKERAEVEEPENLGEKTIAEFLALKNTKDTCVLTGKVIEIVNDQYGNLTIEDATGSLYVYGVLTPAGESKKFSTLDVAVNDVLTIKATYTEFNGNPQAKNAIFVSREKATPSAIDNTTVAGKAQKMIIDGQLFIIRDGVMFNANGAAVK